MLYYIKYKVWELLCPIQANGYKNLTPLFIILYFIIYYITLFFTLFIIQCGLKESLWAVSL